MSGEQDKDLDPLRDREDFKKLLAQVEEKKRGRRTRGGHGKIMQLASRRTEGNMTPTLTALPDVPPDVLNFAGEKDLVGNLQPILTITKTHFPDAAISLRLEDDPEIADDRHIVVAVNVTGWSVERMLAARNGWTQDLFKVCLSLDVCAFRIRMEQDE